MFFLLNCQYYVVKGLPVYVDKQSCLSLPGMSEDTSSSSSGSITKTVTSFEMINVLVQILIPKDIQHQITISNIPPIIVTAIQCKFTIQH